jgi:hypothetical protein
MYHQRPSVGIRRRQMCPKTLEVIGINSAWSQHKMSWISIAYGVENRVCKGKFKLDSVLLQRYGTPVYGSHRVRHWDI